jgi:Sec-independent protein translocase protein TatA
MNQDMKQDGPKTAGEAEQSRAFEQWFLNGSKECLDRSPSGYSCMKTNAAWRAWKAAIAHAKSQPSEVEVPSVPTVDRLLDIYDASFTEGITNVSSKRRAIEAVREAMQRWFVKTLDHFTESGKCVICGTVGGTVVSTKDYMAEVEARKTAEYKLESAEAELKHLQQTLDQTATALQERDEAQSELDQIKELLPDESPCKHEVTGHSLYDDIDTLVREHEGYKKTLDAIFGMLYKAGDHNGNTLAKVDAVIKDRDSLREKLENLASLKSHLVTAELERDRLQNWKDQMLTVESWWSKVDEFVRNHPKAPIGQNVSDIALQWLRAYMEEKSK